MPEIPDIGINQIDININPIFDIRTPRVLVPQHPVTTILAKPIVSYPGCVEHAEAVEDNKKYIQCDGQVPSYNAMEYNPEEMTVIKKQEANPVNNDTESPPAPPPPNAPITPAATAKVSCPTEAQEAKEPVGTFIEGFRQKVTGYKLIGNECIGTVMTTGGIAVVATSSALLAKPLADILLKVIKPTVKKVVKKIAAIRGKPVPVLSVTERRDLQRERTQAIRALKSALKPKG
jgi:hypothetical protein